MFQFNHAALYDCFGNQNRLVPTYKFVCFLIRTCKNKQQDDPVVKLSIRLTAVSVASFFFGNECLEIRQLILSRTKDNVIDSSSALFVIPSKIIEIIISLVNVLTKLPGSAWCSI